MTLPLEHGTNPIDSHEALQVGKISLSFLFSDKSENRSVDKKVRREM